MFPEFLLSCCCSDLLPGLSSLLGSDTCETLIYILSVMKLCLHFYNTVTQQKLCSAVNHYLPSVVGQVFIGCIPGCPFASALEGGLCLPLPQGSHARLILCHTDVHFDYIGL